MICRGFLTFQNTNIRGLRQNESGRAKQVIGHFFYVSPNFENL